MSKSCQAFFWTPDELTDWVKRICAEFGLWLVVWRVGQDAELVRPEELRSTWFSGPDDSIQLFLGDPALCPEPLWRIASGRRELDFSGSYAVQLVPSLIATDGQTLLEGRLAIMREADYGDPARYCALSALFKRLKGDLRRSSDTKHVIVQSGSHKRWTDILVSPAVASCVKTLKQFSRGAVEFHIQRR